MVGLFSKFYNKNLIGVDIGEDTIKIVEGYQSGGKIHVKKCIKVKTPEASYSNGNIKNLELLGDALKAGIDEAKMTSRNMVFTMDSLDIVDRHIVVPTTKSKEIQKMLEFEIQQQLPISMGENVVQTRIAEKISDGETSKTDVLVVAVNKELVNRYLSVAKYIKREPYALDTVFDSLDKMFGNKIYLNQKDVITEKTVAIIDIGHTTININVYKNGNFMFNRILSQGSYDLDSNISNMFGVDMKEARSTKENLGNINELYSDSGEDESSRSLESLMNTAVKSTVDRWGVEINKVFKYFTSREVGTTIDKIYLYGGGSRINGLERYLEDYFEIPTTKLLSADKVLNETQGKELAIDVYLNAISSLVRLD